MRTEVRPAAATNRRARTPLAALAVLVIGATTALALLTPVAPTTAAPAAAPPRVDAGASVHAISVEIAAGRVKGNETLTVRQGERVEVRVSSDRPIVLHLHGYEVEAAAVPPTPALLAFKADLPGRFPVHEHREGAGNHRAVLFVEVHP